MPKVKIPRKSTTIDMTAMCDVAFLLLSFFILATKQKPPEALAVSPPNSISAVAAPDKSIIVTLSKEGKAYILFGEDTKKGEILENLNLTKNLGLSASELVAWKKQDFYGLPLNMVRPNLDKTISATEMPGIPIDTANNEMVDWVASITNAFAGTEQKVLQEMMLVKGDGDAFYPAFKQIKSAFKKNKLYKFRIVTNGEPVPIGSELYRNAQNQ